MNETIKIFEGMDLLNATTKYIAHQCNCTTTNNASGIAKSIFDKYPYSEIYTKRTQEDKPGTIQIFGDGTPDKRFIINMFGQVNPGKPSTPKSPSDGYNIRELYFIRCLKEILKIKDLESIGFPYGIGCGLAGGDWKIYYALLEMFAKKTEAEVILYKLY